MFDFSFAEIALVVIVAVIFIGPKELPVVLRTVSKAMRGMRSLTRELRAAFDDVTREAGLDEHVTMIRGDDGKMYESYTPPPAGGRLGGGRHLEDISPKSPHPGPPPKGEGEV